MAQSIRLGAFVLTTLAILAAFFLLIGRKESKFEATYRLQAQFQNVSGLEEGADVRVGGLHEGTVRQIVLPPEPNGKMTVVMDLSRKTGNLIKQDSIASIKSEGLVGNKYVEISFGSMASLPVRSGSMIGSEPPLDISDLMGKANQILGSANGVLDNLHTAAANVGTITNKINSGQGTVGALINDKSMYKEADEGVAALHEDADALKHNFLLRGFFKKRGFADPEEMQKYTIAQLPSGPPEKEFDYDAQRLFGQPPSAKLKDQKELNKVGGYLQAQNPGLIVIESSAGPMGESEKDQELSEERAFAVRSYFLDHFKLNDSRLKIIGIGKSEAEPSLRILTYNIAPQSAQKK
jgi:phospholipid/cholesterol/gamma-HCH transport system substrate-binding protein